MQLLQAFKDFIREEDLFSQEEKLLVAVSGGLDSVVLCDLCSRTGYDLVIAHCNFGLRGGESLRDEAFVRELGARHGREVKVRHFDTAVYAAERKVSIQVAARELRYAWFRELVDSGVAGYVVTAHHLDDNIETLLMNFFKGTGMAGLRAMLPKQGVVVRPLLSFSREMIRQYASERGLAWVEDSSNLSDKYTRNYFRHQVIPLVARVYPAAMGNLAANIDRFREIETVYRQAVEEQKKKLMAYRGNEVHIPVRKLMQTAALDTLLYEIAAPYGFSPQQAEACRELLESPSGRYLVSATHRILKDRNWLIISPLQTAAATHVLVESGDEAIAFAQGVLRLQRLPADRIGNIDQGPRVALLDAASIAFPLLLRPWRAGDYFYPLGMRKKKKLARFFIDNKLSVAEKEKVWVVEMDKKILWVVGRRIDDRWRLSPGTRAVLRIEWRPD